ncbi:SIMPL domain-containing protein [Lysobacter korlensis]|uniref:SIMPL domain-containing protein n=1 Tax=Lysobacter korlensis TaxID=553636 RepID=A0ABV6RRF7_9GAMM
MDARPMRHLLLAALLIATPAFAGTPLPDAPHVMASGEGKTSVAPDLARITLTARYRNAAPAAAKQSVDRSIEAFLDLAPRFGLKPSQVTAADLSVSEDVDYDERDRKMSNGFIATREVTVELHELDRLGEFLDAALAAGMNEIDNVAFESSRADALRAEARDKAVAQAREKAGGLAQAFGAALGQVYSSNSLNSVSADGYGAATLDRVEVTGSRIQRSRYVQPTVEYSERVSAVFELKRGSP